MRAGPPGTAPLHDVLRRVLLVVGAVLLLTLAVALVALTRSLHLLDDGLDPAPLEAVRQWNEVLLWVTLVLVLLVIGMGAFLWRALRHGVTEPLERLASAVRAASTGSHEHEIPISGTGEVAALAADVEHMRRELVEQARELERSNRDLEQFAYVASHDLQEPLRKVASFTQLLQKRYGGQLDERADQYIGFAADGAIRMQRLIQDLLSFSRVGRSGAEPVDVDLNDVLTVVLRDLDERITEARAVVTYDPLPVVRGERVLLAMLLTNVVSNALKFRDPQRTAKVHLSARREGEQWEVSCTDNGIGIDPQYADRVFVIFQRLHTKESYSGTGIGLALVKRVVEHHGGRVWIEPAPDRGTTVRWTLQGAGADASGRLTPTS